MKDSVTTIIDKLDSLSNIMDFRLENDLHIYPFVRFIIIQKYIDKTNNLSNPWERKGFKISKWNLAKYFIQSYLQRPRFRNKHKSKILIFGTDIGNIEDNGGFTNRIVDSFYNAYPDITYLIESSNAFSYKRPRNVPVSAFDLLAIKANIICKFKRLSVIDKSNIDGFLLYLKTEACFLEFDIDDLMLFKNHLYNSAKKSNIYKCGFFKWIQKSGCELILVEEGCYGGRSAILVNVAKTMCIKIFEHQHGAITKYHPAYNYSKNINRDYLKYLPDALLCYGEYWERQSSLPISIELIGNPYLTECVSKYSYIKKDAFLIASSGIQHELIKKIVIEIKRRRDFSAFNIVFRPHPAEYQVIENLYPELIKLGVEIDTGPLYPALAKSLYVAGEISTVLFEAVAFKCKVFILDSEYSRGSFTDVPFDFFKNIDDIVGLLGNENITNKNQIAKIWQNDWSNRYQNIITNIIQL